MGCKCIRFRRYPTRSFESEILLRNAVVAGGGGAPSGSEQAHKPTERSRSVLIALQQTERRADEHAGDRVPAARCASSRRQGPLHYPVQRTLPLAQVTQKRRVRPRRGREPRARPKSVPLGTVKPGDSCWTPQGPFPTVVRISSGRFTFSKSLSEPRVPMMVSALLAETQLNVLFLIPGPKTLLPMSKGGVHSSAASSPGTRRRGLRVTPAAAFEPRMERE